jgi:hypothetical protein
MQTHWRLAVMFDAREGDLGALERGLIEAGETIRGIAGVNPVRLGVTLARAGESSDDGAHDVAALRTVDGAIEITLPNGSDDSIVTISRGLRTTVESLAQPGSVEVMAGAMHHMVPVRAGEVFLSLAFRRFPGTSVPQFRTWWHDQHAPIAIPVLTEELLLAYDQVHVDEVASRQAAAAAGVPYFDYDAYDNLTFDSAAAFDQACSDLPGMTRIAADEVGRIDNTTRRHALMREL